MSIDILQEKIRKTKNPTVMELSVSLNAIPQQYSQDGAGYCQFCEDLMNEFKGFIPAVRVSFAAFSLLGHDGLYQLTRVLKKATEQGFYVLLDSPEIHSVDMAQRIADMFFCEDSLYPWDTLEPM